VPTGDVSGTGHDDDGAAPLRWAAPVAAIVLALVAGLGLLAWAVAADDPPGRVLAGLAALSLLGTAAFGAVSRPRLAVDDAGVTVRGPFRAATWSWDAVDAVRIVRSRRVGLPVTYLEIEMRDDDGAERLLVLGRLELGTDPVDVATALQDHRAAAGRRGRRDDEA